MNYKEIIKSKYFNDVYTKIEELKKDYYVNHGFIHIDGVIKNAEYLAALFGLDAKQKQLLLIASALHDVGYLMGRENHAGNGAVLAKEYLTGKMSEEDVDAVCKVIASHGGRNDEDYCNPISMCLVLADKLDFTKARYRDDGQEHKYLPLFSSIEKVLLCKASENNYKLNIYTTKVQLFDGIDEISFFNKLKWIFEKVKNVCGYNIQIDVCEIEATLEKE